MDRLQRFLHQSLQELNQDAMAAGRIFELWDRAVGEAIAAKAHPYGLRAGVLWVEVASPAWAHELSLMKPQLLAALARLPGVGALRDLRFQVVVPGARAPREVVAPSDPGLVRSELDPATKQQIRAAVAGLQDPRLAEVVARALESAARRRAAQQRAGYVACPRCGDLRPPGQGACARCRASETPGTGIS